ncbi:RNA polymerase sigma factor [Persicitalea jodogahamensis]|uniref:RNA polymerase sigma factor n=1 Tax=Persicitalea jodogahamensis TaxID=402147 RepID=UPI001E3C23EE|nr:sigma-70 family RNA polymerase sigma factor [Persicitalea jodogahamensis]
MSKTDEQLWQDLISGDESAFSTLFERHHSLLVGYGISLISHRETVQDCVQDVFVDVWLYRQSLNPSVSAKAYLISSVRKRIARRHERDKIFRKTTQLDDSLEKIIEFSLDFTVEDRLIANEETLHKVRQLNQMLNALNARQREALYLRYHQGLSVDEIADILDINKQSVSNLLHRALRQLRRDWTGSTPLFLLVSYLTI